MQSKNRIMINMIILLIALSYGTMSQSEQDLVDITAIPMLPQNYQHRIYAGYLNVTNNVKSFYYVFFERYLFFYESQSVRPQDDPVVLWLNGGPGCSSFIGMVTQHGPFLFKPGTTQMYLNPYSWNKRANVIYLQSPGDVGFSWASKAAMITNDTQTAADNLVALRLFFEKFPSLESNDFYITGQSYAGIYVPMLAKQILQFNAGSQDMTIKLRGIMLGNPCTHKFECLTPILYPRFAMQKLYTTGFIQKELYNQYQGECLVDQLSKTCRDLQNKIIAIFKSSGASIYNLYGECFHPKYPSQFKKLAGQQAIQRFEKKNKANLKHPLSCGDALGALTLFNANEYRQALNVYQLNDTLQWTPCSDVILQQNLKNLDYQIDVGQTYNILPLLVRQGLKVMYYSGDQDGILPTQGTVWWFQQYRNQFGAAIKKSWRPWITKNQDISGMLWQLEGITLATVIGAGHMVPTDKPAQAQEIFNVFLGYSQWKFPDYFEE